MQLCVGFDFDSAVLAWQNGGQMPPAAAAASSTTSYSHRTALRKLHHVSSRNSVSIFVWLSVYHRLRPRSRGSD